MFELMQENKMSLTVPLGVHLQLDLLGSHSGSGCLSPPLGLPPLQPFGLPPLPPPFDLSLSGKIVPLTVNMNNRMIMFTNENNSYLFFFQHKWKYNHKSDHYYECWYSCSNTCTSEIQNTNGNTYNSTIGTMIHTWILCFCPLKRNETPLTTKGKHDVGVTDVVVASFNTIPEPGSGYNSNGLPKKSRQHIDDQFIYFSICSTKFVKPFIQHHLLMQHDLPKTWPFLICGMLDPLYHLLLQLLAITKANCEVFVVDIVEEELCQVHPPATITLKAIHEITTVCTFVSSHVYSIVIILPIVLSIVLITGYIFLMDHLTCTF